MALTVLGTLLGSAALAHTGEDSSDSKNKMVVRAASQVKSVVNDARPEIDRFNSKMFLSQKGESKFKDDHYRR